MFVWDREGRQKINIDQIDFFEIYGIFDCEFCTDLEVLAHIGPTVWTVAKHCKSLKEAQACVDGLTMSAAAMPNFSPFAI